MLRCCLLVALVGGCDLGEVGGEATGDAAPLVDADTAAAAASFTAMITPMVTPPAHTCASQASCHNGSFPPNLTSYALFAASGSRYLMKPGSTNILITKAATLAGTGGMHNALPYLTPAEQTAFAAWIDSL